MEWIPRPLGGTAGKGKGKVGPPPRSGPRLSLGAQCPALSQSLWYVGLPCTPPESAGETGAGTLLQGVPSGYLSQGFQTGLLGAPGSSLVPRR